MISLEVQGMRHLHADLNALGTELAAKLLASAARKAFKPVLETAQALAPVDTGTLRDNIKIRVVKPKTGDSVVVVGLRIAKVKNAPNNAGSPDWRWHFVELGTKHIAAQPFLRPALEQNAAGVVAALKVELRKKIDRAVKRRAKAAKK